MPPPSRQESDGGGPSRESPVEKVHSARGAAWRGGGGPRRRAPPRVRVPAGAACGGAARAVSESPSRGFAVGRIVSSRVEPSRAEPRVGPRSGSRVRACERTRRDTGACWSRSASPSVHLVVVVGSVCASLVGASPSAIVPDMEAYQNGRDRADVFVSV